MMNDEMETTQLQQTCCVLFHREKEVGTVGVVL